MVEQLAASVDAFGGSTSHTRCFAHTLNLVAKTVLHQFEVSLDRAGGNLDANEAALRELAAGLDVEDEVTIEERVLEATLEGEDSLEGWVDETLFLTEEELADLKEDTLPVKSVLVKVRYTQIRAKY